MERIRLRLNNRIRRLQRRQAQLADDFGCVPTGRRYEYQTILEEVNLCRDGLELLDMIGLEDDTCIR